MSGPRVSVVVAVHNCERYLPAAIDSVLAQVPLPHQVVVVDDGSTDASAQVARSYDAPVRALRQPRRGAAAARNVGVAATTGEYLAFLDADDAWTEDALDRLLHALVSNPTLDLVFGHVREFVSDEIDGGKATRFVARHGLLPGYLTGSVLMRRTSFDSVGGFREDVDSGEFLDWIARSRDLGQHETLIGNHVLWRRIHGENHGIRRADARVDYARVLKSALDRRRAAANQRSGSPEG